MNNDERDELLIELRTDIKWIKGWISNQNKYKLLVYGALITAIIGLLN